MRYPHSRQNGTDCLLTLTKQVLHHPARTLHIPTDKLHIWFIERRAPGCGGGDLRATPPRGGAPGKSHRLKYLPSIKAQAAQLTMTYYTNFLNMPCYRGKLAQAHATYIVKRFQNWPSICSIRDTFTLPTHRSLTRMQCDVSDTHMRGIGRPLLVTNLIADSLYAHASQPTRALREEHIPGILRALIQQNDGPRRTRHHPLVSRLISM